jgi:hypothetical protein
MIDQYNKSVGFVVETGEFKIKHIGQVLFESLLNDSSLVSILLIDQIIARLCVIKCCPCRTMIDTESVIVGLGLHCIQI